MTMMHLLKMEWGWEELRDYVISESEKRFGVQPRDARKEASVFKRFVGEYGDTAKPIAKYAFEVEDGRWMGAPVTVNRFAKGSDPYFAEVIVQRLSERATLAS